MNEEKITTQSGVVDSTPATTETTEKKEDKRKLLPRIIAVVIIIILLLLGLRACSGPKVIYKEPGSVTLEAGEDTENKDNPLKDLYVTYSGITDATINEDTIVQLENLEENGDIVIKFTVKEGNKVIHDTDYVASGKHLNWEAGKDLTKGEHTLTLIQTPKIMVDGKYVPLTSGTCEFVLTRI